MGSCVHFKNRIIIFKLHLGHDEVVLKISIAISSILFTFMVILLIPLTKTSICIS